MPDRAFIITYNDALINMKIMHQLKGARKLDTQINLTKSQLTAGQVNNDLKT